MKDNGGLIEEIAKSMENEHYKVRKIRVLDEDGNEFTELSSWNSWVEFCKANGYQIKQIRCWSCAIVLKSNELLPTFEFYAQEIE